MKSLKLLRKLYARKLSIVTNELLAAKRSKNSQAVHSLELATSALAEKFNTLDSKYKVLAYFS
jgi:hypothetical protein